MLQSHRELWWCLSLTIAHYKTLTRNVTQLKGNKLAAVFRHRWNLSTFLFGCYNNATVDSIQSGFWRGFQNGVCYFGILKVIKKTEKYNFCEFYWLLFKLCGQSFQIALDWDNCNLHLFSFSIPKRHLDLAFLPIDPLAWLCMHWYEKDQLELSIFSGALMPNRWCRPEGRSCASTTGTRPTSSSAAAVKTQTFATRDSTWPWRRWSNTGLPRNLINQVLRYYKIVCFVYILIFSHYNERADFLVFGRNLTRI
jgi:hypothetical protein